MSLFQCIVLFSLTFSSILAELEPIKKTTRGATMKPISICCDMPELGSAQPLQECSNLGLDGPCDNIECIFEKSGFLTDKNLNREAYKNHLRQFAEEHKDWSEAIERVIRDCVEKEPPYPRNAGLWQLHVSCKAHDVFSCTTTAMLRACPKTHWKC